MGYQVHDNGFESTSDARSMVGGLFAMLGIPVACERPDNRAERRADAKRARCKKRGRNGR